MVEQGFKFRSIDGFVAATWLLRLRYITGHGPVRAWKLFVV